MTTNIPKIESKSPLQVVTDLCAWGVILLAGLALLGWLTGLRLLASVFADYIPMAISTAVSFIIIGSLLLLRHHSWAIKHNFFLATISALFTVFHFINLLVYFISNGNLTVDVLLFPGNEVLQTFPVNRMSPITAATFFISALTLYLLYRTQGNGGTTDSAALLGFVVFEVGSISVIGYLYGTPLLYGGSVIPLALTTALAFTFLGVGLIAACGADSLVLRLFSGPRLRTRLLRTFLPITTLLILTQGYLRQFFDQTNINPALWDALTSILFAALMGVSITFVGRFVEQAVDRVEAERQKADEHLRESEARYRDLVENSQDLICTHDMEGRLLTINPAATRLLGYDLKELIGSNIRDYLVPEMRERFSDYIRRIKHDGAATGLLFMQTKSGERRIWEYNNTVRSEGTAEPIVRGMARDITERRQAEQEARRSESILNAVAFSAERLLKGSDFEKGVNDVLEKLGTATHSSRVYIFERESPRADDGETCVTQRYEWAAPGIPPQIENPEMTNFPLRQMGFERWIDHFSQNKPIHGYVDEMPESEQAVLASQDILSIATLPIFVDQTWWGFIGVDECLNRRRWSVAELEALRVAADTLGAAIQRQKAEHDLQTQHDFAQKILNHMGQGLTVTDNDRHFVYVNPA
ncbi:MAG: PAS domain S-box protein, partial [Chloroflexi bacterium]|nr:PAS domain S-box protein [Chloroflexota bacterium]